MLSRPQKLLADFAASMDAAAVRLGHVAMNVLFWPLLYAVTIGSGVFALQHPAWVPAMDTNKIHLVDSARMVVWIAVTFLGLGVAYGVAVSVAGRLAARAGEPPPAAGTVLAELHRRLRPLLALPVVAALTLFGIERESPKETLFLIGLAGVAAGVSAYAWLTPAPRRSTRERVLSWILVVATAALWARLLAYVAPVFPDAVVTKIIDRAALLPADRRAILGSLPFAAGVLSLSAFSGAALGVHVRGWLGLVPPLAAAAEGGDDDAPRRQRGARMAAAALLAAIWAGYGVFFSRFSIINHHALHSAVIDLGYYDNIFYQSIHGRPLGCTFIRSGYHGSAHFDPILVVLSPLYLLYPRAEFLLVLQSVWLGMGVVPVYLLARTRGLGRPSGVAIAAMYATYPALHGANMYEFHSLTLLAPVALWQIYFLESGRHRSYWALLLPTLLVREDASILLCFIGAYAVLSRRSATLGGTPRPLGWARLGWVTIALSLVYLVVVKRFFMASMDLLGGGKDAYSFAYYYDDLIPNHNSSAGLLISLVTNPVFVLKTMLGEPKLVYVTTLFLPLAFLPFLARPGRFMLVWGLLFTTLASRPAVYSTHFQYSAIIIPVAFSLLPDALRQVEDGAFVRARGLDALRFRRAMVAACLTMSLLASWKFGGILPNASFHGGFGPPARSMTAREQATYDWIRAEVSKIPIRDSVAATNRVGAHISNRAGAYLYPDHRDVDWLFLDESELHGADLERHNKEVQSGVFELVSRHERLAIYRRKVQR